MNPAVQAVICGRRRQQVTQTFSANATWTAPITTSRIDTAAGKGASGTPPSSGSRSAFMLGDSVLGHSSGSGSLAGVDSWSYFQSDVTAAFNSVNGGGTGSWYGVSYDAYPGTNTHDIALLSSSYADAVAGTASISYGTGWKASGAILPTDFGNFRINYTQTYTVAATTGASATAFGKTFPGGTGGAASVTTFSNLIVTPGATYNIVVPAGGSLTITYFQ